MNLFILLVGVVFNLHETAHFGWHLFPRSDAELICDGISLVLFCLAINRRTR